MWCRSGWSGSTVECGAVVWCVVCVVVWIVVLVVGVVVAGSVWIV